jgi:hypothetical protein
MKKTYKEHIKDILIHDVEVAAFVLVSVSLVATLTSFAMDRNPNNLNTKNTSTTNKITGKIYNPQMVQVIDLDGDGVNDMIINHVDGHVEHAYSR